MRILYSAVIIADNECSWTVSTVLACKNCVLGIFLVLDIVLSENVIHLLLSPFAPLAWLAVIYVLIIDEADELHSSIVTAAAPCVKVSKSAGSLLLLPCLEALAYAVVVPEVVENILVLALCVSDLLNEVELRVLLVYYSPHNACTAPHIVPAVAPARRSIVIEYLYSIIK